MIPMDISVDAALNLGFPASTPAQPPAAGAAEVSTRLTGKTGAGNSKGASFHDELRAAVHDQTRAARAHKEPLRGSSAGRPRGEDPGPSQPAADKITKEQDLQKDDPHGCPEIQQDIRELWSSLLRILQGISTALKPAESVSEPNADGAVPELPEDDPAETLSQLLDILNPLQEAAQDAVPSSEATALLQRVCDQLKALAAATPSAELPLDGRRVLQDLREQLSGLAWDRVMNEVAADGSAPAPGAEKEAAPVDARIPVPADVADRAQNIPEGGLQEALRRMMAEATAGERDPRSMAVGSRAASIPGSASEDAKPQGIERVPLPAIPAAAGSPPTRAGESDRGLEAARTLEATIDPAGPLSGVPEEQGSFTGEDRRSTDDHLIARTLAGEAASEPEKGGPSEPFDMGMAGQRVSHLHENSAEKTAAAAGLGKDKEAAGGSRAAVFDQIVQRAIVQVRNDQSEIRIDLKPDFLGHVRMQVVSENQQVSVRILTELPAVRDMIETGLQQLRSDLQNQGLHVDRLEVAVSSDSRQPPRRQAWRSSPQKTGGIDAVSGTGESVADGRIEPMAYPRRPGKTANIDMFV